MNRLHALVPLLVLSGACSGASTDNLLTEDILIPFEARYGGEVVTCGTTYDAPSGASETFELLDLRMYVSNIRVWTASGNEVPVTLVADDTWQTDNVALLDFEDGSGGCSASGNAETHTLLRGEVAPGTFTGLTFDVGLPFEDNHADPLSSPSPLNVASMFWAWQSGHKFVRADFQNDAAAPDNKWFFHLGSTDCVSDAATQAPSVDCGRPNVATITLDGFDPSQGVAFDLEQLLTNVDLGSDTPGSAPGCMSTPDDAAECGDIYANLGISYETGTCERDCAGQTAFQPL